MSGRARNTLTYVGAFLVCTAALVAIVYFFGDEDASGEPLCPVVGYVRIWPGEIEITTLRDITIDSKNNLHGTRLDPSTGDALGAVIHREWAAFTCLPEAPSYWDEENR